MGEGVAVGDDAGGSAAGDGFGEADPVGFGGGVAVSDAVGQLVAFGLAVAVVLAVAGAELVAVAGAVAVPVAVALALAGVSGVALGLSLGLAVAEDGVVDGLADGVVDGVAELLGLADLLDFGVSDAFGLAGGQEAAGVGVGRTVLALGMPTPPPFCWPAPRDPAEGAELVVPEPVTVAVSWLISWPSGVSANTRVIANTAQAMPKAGRSNASRQSPRRPRPRAPAPDRAPATPPDKARTREARERPPARAGADFTRARIRSRPSERGSI